METLSVEAAAKKIKIYLSRDTARPYFVIADGADECNELKNFFSDCEQIFISDFCRGDLPLDTDLLVEKLKGIERNALVFGLGEYIFFTAQENNFRLPRRHEHFGANGGRGFKISGEQSLSGRRAVEMFCREVQPRNKFSRRRKKFFRVAQARGARRKIFYCADGFAAGEHSRDKKFI